MCVVGERSPVIRSACCSLLVVLSIGCGTGVDPAPASSTVFPIFTQQNFVLGVDNPYFPLNPGTVRIYEKDTQAGLVRIVSEVLDAARVILGVACTVVRDTVTLDGELVEVTRDWFAQDEDGNVWYLGEDANEYENSVLVSKAGSWEAGVDGAEAGILMFAHPAVGTTYRHEYYAGEAEDMATVLAVNATATVPYGTFFECVKTADFSPLEPGVVEETWYAAGVGPVLEVDDEGVRTELISVGRS